MMQPLAIHVPGTFTLTAAATTFIRRMIRLSGLGLDAGFRLVVSAGGCSGIQDTFDISARPEDGDEVLRFDDITLFVPATCRPLLAGVIIDFVDSSTKTGFEFTDPKATRCCSTD